MASLPSVGRKREHTRGEFIEVAARLIEDEGIEALTARRLGTEIGVSPTAIYTYFATREDLMGALVDHISAQIMSSVQFDGDSAHDRILAVALAVRRTLVERPRLAAVFSTASRKISGGTDSLIFIVRILESTGLTGDELVSAYRALESYVFGATIFDLGAAPEHVSLRRERYLATEHPAFVAVAKSNSALERNNEDAFAMGLELLLKGLGL